MTRFILVRHGDVEGIDPPRFRGRTDIPLSKLGRAQASATASAIARRWRVDGVYASPMTRCQETARAIAGAGAPAIHVLEDLNDIDYGAWRWLTFEAVRARSPIAFARWLNSPQRTRFPGGERLSELMARTSRVFEALVAAHRRETVVIVGHDSVNRALLMHALALPLSAYWRLEQWPCGVSEIEVDGGRIRLVRMNETAHLEGLTP